MRPVRWQKTHDAKINNNSLRFFDIFRRFRGSGGSEGYSSKSGHSKALSRSIKDDGGLGYRDGGWTGGSRQIVYDERTKGSGCACCRMETDSASPERELHKAKRIFTELSGMDILPGNAYSSENLAFETMTTDQRGLQVRLSENFGWKANRTVA